MLKILRMFIQHGPNFNLMSEVTLPASFPPLRILELFIDDYHGTLSVLHMLSSTSVRGSLVDLHLQSETYDTKTDPASFYACIRYLSVFSHLVHITILFDSDTM
jgi:hypothetical protein